MSQTNRKFCPRSGQANFRLIILIGLLLLVGAAFWYDKYTLLPNANEKINKVLDEVTLSLNEGNRKQVEEIVGISPSSTFNHGNLEVVQYRFPRGLPFYPSPILDIAYDGNTIAIVKPTELTPELLDQLKPTNRFGDLNRETRDESIIVGLGGGRSGSANEPNNGGAKSGDATDDPSDNKTPDDSTAGDEGSSDDDSSDEAADNETDPGKGSGNESNVDSETDQGG